MRSGLNNIIIGSYTRIELSAIPALACGYTEGYMAFSSFLDSKPSVNAISLLENEM